jgi:N-acetylglucosamine kinase-like BadF-type ATPase
MNRTENCKRFYWVEEEEPLTLILGVDGGGSKTRAVVTDDSGVIRGEGQAGCGNHQTSGIDAALAEIRAAAGQAVHEAGAAPDEIAAVCYGLAGADRPADFAVLRPALASLPYRNWDVVCDTMTGLRTGSPDGIGVVLVCGSGTNAAGRNARGETIQTGGFGYLYGDAAGGSHMAEETFRAAVRSWELREIPSRLTQDVPAWYGFETMEQLVNDWLDRGIYHVSSDLTLVLHRAGEAGDELAVRLLRSAGRELGLAAASVILRLGGFAAFGSRPIPIVLTGSVLQKGRSPHLLGALEETLRDRAGAPFELVIPKIEPVFGAVLLAMDRLGFRAPQDALQRWASESPR